MMSLTREDVVELLRSELRVVVATERDVEYIPFVNSVNPRPVLP